MTTHDIIVDDLKRELGMLRELVGVRADAQACAADAQHWLKLMAAWDENVNLRAKLKVAREENDFLQSALSAFEWQRINTLSHEEVKAELLAEGYTQERLDEGLRKIRETVEKALATRAAQEGS